MRAGAGVGVRVGVRVRGIAACHRAQERRGHAECRHAGAPRLVRVRVRVRRLGFGLVDRVRVNRVKGVPRTRSMRGDN